MEFQPQTLAWTISGFQMQLTDWHADSILYSKSSNDFLSQPRPPPPRQQQN